MKITKILLIILFFTLPLIHGRILQTLWIDLSLKVAGNFEFSKVVYFNIFSACIFVSFFIEKLREKSHAIHISYLQIIALGILALSTLFSLSPFTSLIADTGKWHGFFLYTNLLGLYIVLRNIPESFYKTLIQTLIFSAIFACIIAIKELFFPRFDYGALENRAFGTFGHPNYLGAYLLFLLPFMNYIKNLYLRSSIFALCILTIILTKSLVAIIGVWLYLLYILYPICSSYIHIRSRHTIVLFSSLSFLIIWGYLLILFFPEKLHSFLSRFYLWETTLLIIFSDIKIFFFGAGAETLPYFFNSYKVPEVYIYENYGYSADRPHNFFLSIWYHFGIIALVISLYLILRFSRKNIHSRLPEVICLFLFLYFGSIHFFSISVYIVIMLAYIILRTKSLVSDKIYHHLSIFLIFIIFSILGGFLSFKIYSAETYAYRDNFSLASKTFPHPNYFIELSEYEKAARFEWLVSAKNIKEQIIESSQREELCHDLVSRYESAENYFYCGQLLEIFGNTQSAIHFYTTWLEKLPDLWNEDSPYWEQYFIKKTITGNRFFSEKYSPLKEILEKVEK